MTAASDPERTSAEARLALSRRNFLKSAGGVAAGGALAHGLLTASAAAQPAASADFEALADFETLEGEIEIKLSINGETKTVKVEPRTTLLNTLRNHCEPPLTGTKIVCDRGQCGACTVHVDGKPAYACMLLAADMRGKDVRTIEGLGTPQSLTPLQQAFWKYDASMCGFCTPGFVMAISACLQKNPKADLSEIKQSCAGNVCRCGTYPHIFKAALEVAGHGSTEGKR